MSDHPKPAGSPTPDADEVVADRKGSKRTQTGEMRAAMKPALNAFGAKLTAALGGLSVTVALTTAWFVFHAIEARAQAIVDAGMKTQEQRLTAVEQQVPQLRQEVFESRMETRDLYKAVMERKRSARLERPPPPIDAGIPIIVVPPVIDGGP